METCKCRFQSYEEDSEGLTVHFEGEGAQSLAVRAKVLVGADGYFSAVRQQCLGDGPPDFAVGLQRRSQHCGHAKMADVQEISSLHVLAVV